MANRELKRRMLIDKHRRRRLKLKGQGGVWKRRDEFRRMADSLLRRNVHVLELGGSPVDAEWLANEVEHVTRLEEAGFRLHFWGPGPKNCYQDSRVFFSNDKERWIVIHRNYKQRVKRESIIYSSKEVLLLRWTNNTIAWKHTVNIPRVPR